MSVKERIKCFIKSKNIVISDFEKQIGVANGYVNSISKGIGTEKLETILEYYPNLNLNWLLTGVGEMEMKINYINVRFNEVAMCCFDGNSSKMAKALSTSEANIQNYRSNTEPETEILNKLVELHNIDYEWLLTGKGTMFKEEEKQNINLQQGKLITESLSVSDLVRALDNISESVRLNAIANERNSRNMEKMLEMLSEKDKSMLGKEVYVYAKQSKEDVAQTA